MAFGLFARRRLLFPLTFSFLSHDSSIKLSFYLWQVVHNSEMPGLEKIPQTVGYSRHTLTTSKGIQYTDVNLVTLAC